jgi:hypothetical protein
MLGQCCESDNTYVRTLNNIIPYVVRSLGIGTNALFRDTYCTVPRDDAGARTPNASKEYYGSILLCREQHHSALPRGGLFLVSPSRIIVKLVRKRRSIVAVSNSCNYSNTTITTTITVRDKWK